MGRTYWSGDPKWECPHCGRVHRTETPAGSDGPVREQCRRCGETVAVDERTLLGAAGGRESDVATDGAALVGEDVLVTDDSSAYYGRRGTVTAVSQAAFGRRAYAVSVGEAELRGVDEDDVERLTGLRYVGLRVRRSLGRVRSWVGRLTEW